MKSQKWVDDIRVRYVEFIGEVFPFFIHQIAMSIICFYSDQFVLLFSYEFSFEERYQSLSKFLVFWICYPLDNKTIRDIQQIFQTFFESLYV